MKKYGLLIVVSFGLVLTALLAGFVLAPVPYIGEQLPVSGLFNQNGLNLHAPRISIANPGHVSFERVSDQAITLQLPETYLQKQLNLALETAPFGLEARDYQNLPQQVCLTFLAPSETGSPVQHPATSPLIDWKAAWDDLSSPAYDSYVISLWHPSPALNDYTLVVDQDELLGIQSDPSLACADFLEKTEIEW